MNRTFNGKIDMTPIPKTLTNADIMNQLKVKEKQEKEKIGSKPDKNGKRGEAGKSQKQLQLIEKEKLNKTQKEWPETQTHSKAIQVLKERIKERD
nr:hypothetical protein [Tanacetum cinerariifolium]